MEANDAAPGAPADGWETLGDFAARLGRNKSTISRQIAAGKIPAEFVRRDFDGRVWLDAVRAEAALRGAINPLLSRAPPPPPAAAPAAATEAAPASPTDDRSTAVAGVAAEKQARAALLQLKLQQELGTVLDKQDTYDAFIEVGALLRDALETRRHLLSQDLAGLKDPAEIAAVLQRADDQALASLVTAFNRLVDLGVEERAHAA